MKISDWLSTKEKNRYTPVREPRQSTSGVADGAWLKCERCKKIIYGGEMDHQLQTCPTCGFHFSLTARQRIGTVADEGSFQEMDADVASCDPLGFVATRAYVTQLESAEKKTGLKEAVVTGCATIGGRAVVLGCMDFGFIGASMGSVVGEKVVRAFDLATREKLPVVFFAASGGARMQEGILSLMQMARTVAATNAHAEAGLPYICVLTNPAYGGVMASFATRADVILAEPEALVGFSGQRVIEQTIRQKLPKGFQRAESMLEHGMLDDVVPRPELKARLALLLDYFVSGGASTSAASAPAADAPGGER
ncbi:MAG: acetyl-CoA carboxylase, carboxyltransferase subunit beta [Coriobacteriia bacterium]